MGDAVVLDDRGMKLTANTFVTRKRVEKIMFIWTMIGQSVTVVAPVTN